MTVMLSHAYPTQNASNNFSESIGGDGGKRNGVLEMCIRKNSG